MSWKEAMIVGALFNVFWFICVVGQNAFLWLSVLFIAASWWRYRRTMMVSMVIALIGITIDSAWYHAGLFDFTASSVLVHDANIHDPNTLDLNTRAYLIPYWLMVLWVGFGSFAWLMRHTIIQSPKIIIIVFLAVGGPISYLAGYQLQAVQWPLGIELTLSALLTTWMLLAVVLIWLVGCFYRRFEDV